MALGASKLAAFAKSDMGDEPMVEDYEVEGEENAAGADEAAEDEIEVSDEEGFGEFLDLLMEYAPEIDAAANDIAEELNHDSMPSQETVGKMGEQVADMPDEVVEGIRTYLVGMPWEDLSGLVDGIASDEDSGDFITNPEQVTGWLYWAAKSAEGEGGDEGEGEEEEEVIDGEIGADEDEDSY